MKQPNTPFIAELVMRQYEHLAVTDRIRLLKELAMILPKDQADYATQTAFVMEKSELHQLQFKQMFTQSKGAK